jgi:hypothetical protein
VALSNLALKRSRLNPKAQHIIHFWHGQPPDKEAHDVQSVTEPSGSRRLNGRARNKNTEILKWKTPLDATNVKGGQNKSERMTTHGTSGGDSTGHGLQSLQS